VSEFTNHKIKKEKKNTAHAGQGRFVGWGERDGEDKEQKESAVGEGSIRRCERLGTLMH